MAYKDGFSHEDSYKTLDKFMPPGYDIYVLGVQEAVNQNIFLAM